MHIETEHMSQERQNTPIDSLRAVVTGPCSFPSNATTADRSIALAVPAMSFGPFHVLPNQRLVLEEDRSLRLGGRALDILVALVERAGEPVSKSELMTRVWPDTFVGADVVQPLPDVGGNRQDHPLAACSVWGYGQPWGTLLYGSNSPRYVTSSAESVGRDCAPFWHVANSAGAPDGTVTRPVPYQRPDRTSVMRAVHKIGRWLDRLRHSRVAHDLARDWRRWSRTERIAGSALAIILVLSPVLVCGQ